MNEPAIEQIVAFVREADSLKQIERRNKPLEQERFENSAEHSWQVALMAISLAEYAEPGTDIARTVRLLLVHDLGEIDTGDTIVYAEEGVEERKAEERDAARRIFGLLPPPLAEEFFTLWEEFEEAATAEARFAHALDRAIPALLNLARGGQSWVENGIGYQRVIDRIGPPIRSGCPALWAYLKPQLDQEQERGWFGTRRP